MDAPLEPYCGTPPLPEEIWLRWNLDPALMAGLVALLVIYLKRTSEAVDVVPRRCFLAGWAALTVGLISPICSLSVALFSARVAQHMWLVLLAAPLLALATARMRKPNWLMVGPVTAAGMFAVALWAWHTPRLYQLTFESDVAYWAMHASLIGSAWLFWRTLLLGQREQIARRLLAGFATLIQMGLLGALITFAPRVLYPVHLLTAPMWRLQVLEDQQLGGLLMWVPGCTAIVIALLLMVRQELLRDVDRADLGLISPGKPAV